MANENEIEFTVRIKDDGLGQVAQNIDRVEDAASGLASTAGSAGAGLDKLGDAAGAAGTDLDKLASAEDKAEQQATALGDGAEDAGKGVDGLGDSARDTGVDLGQLAAAVAQKNQAIRSGLALERSEIDLQRQQLGLAREQQQAILGAARARGDEATATQAENRLRQIEVDQLALTARGKRAEAAAIQETVDARRAQLSAVGPLTAAQRAELDASENLAKSLRVQAAAADTAAQRAGELGKSTQEAAQKTEAFPGVLTKVAGAVAGAFAVGRVLEFGKGVNEVADQYKNLESSLRLAIGAGGDLQTTVQGVGDVAKATYSSLDATAQLFGRLAASGKELNITNTEALGITKTINQSIQIGGASAQASEASVRQLVQALQSGVLRGDEFNSIMEQAPRLAKALADGLGVPVGALRGLAEQGQITSAKVVAALKGQSDAINKEFATIPLTTGRALENLNTQWTLFVGTLTGGAQQSSIVAQGINVLAQNLDTLAGVAARGGAVLTAALAVQGVQALRAFSLEMAATGKAASLMSLELSKVPKVINIAVAVTGFEVGYQVGTMLYENTEVARKFGVALVGFYGSLVESMRLLQESAAAIFTSDTVDAAFSRYQGRLAQLKGSYGDLMKSAEEAPTKVGAAADAAAGKATSMGAAAQAAGTQVAQAGAAGAAGVAQVGKAADSAAGAFATLLAAAATPVAKTSAAAQIAADLVEAKNRGVDLDTLLRTQMPEAISKLSGTELAKFRQDFSSAMQLAGADAKLLQTGMRIIGEQAAKSLGVDVVTASSKMGDEFVQANEKMRMLILSLPALKAAGVDTGQVVGEALAKMVDGAKNQAELDAIRTRVVALRKELGTPVADGLLEQAAEKARALKNAVADAKPGIQDVAEAMRKLGVVTDETLKKTATESKAAYDFMLKAGTSSARELGEGFVKAANDAIAANKGIAPAWVLSQAAVRGFEVAVDSAGKAVVKSMTEGSDAVKGLNGNLTRTAEQLKAQQDAWDTLLMRYKLSADYTENQIALLEKQNALLERAAELERKRLNIDKEGFSTDSSGNRIAMGGDLTTKTGLAAFLKTAGVDDDAAVRKIVADFLDEKGNVAYESNRGVKKYGGYSISEALLNAAEKYTFADKNSGTSSIPSQTQTININLNGKSTAVTVATANDAAALKKILEDLADAAGRT